MSSGSVTPTGGGYMRQRYSHGYASSGDDIEDDACSIPMPQPPVFPTARTRIENVVWIVSAVFIVYLGDCESNLIYLLFHDDRIKRLHMFFGLLGIVLNVGYLFYTGVLALDGWKSGESWEISTTYGLTCVTILGLVAFCLFCFALWPIWSFFTLPLVFTLLMASMVILSYLVIKQQSTSDILRID